MSRLMLLLLGLLLAETAPDPDAAEDEQDEDAGDEDESNDDEALTPRDRKLKELSSEAKKWRHKLRQAEARITELGGVTVDGKPHAALIENAFLRAAIARGDDLDLDTTFDLMRLRGFLDAVTVDADGQVQGMDDALTKALSRYPWLTDITLANGDDPPAQPKPRTGGGTHRKPDKSAAARTSLEQRFPALKGRRPH